MREDNPSRVPRKHLASNACGMLDWLRLALICLRYLRLAEADYDL
jgi:hypothetical protein